MLKKSGLEKTAAAKTSHKLAIRSINLRLRELLQLLGLGKGIKLYPTVLQEISLDKSTHWSFPFWQTPKPPTAPRVRDQLAFISKLVSPGDWAIDIGAHVGDTACALAIGCGSNGGVYAFEPNPVTFHILAINATVNKAIGNIIPIPFALSSPLEGDDSIQGEVFEYGDHWLGNGGDHFGISKWRHGSAYEVPVLSVDLVEFMKKYCGNNFAKMKFIKLDCEGRDLPLLSTIVKAWSKYGCSFQWEMKNGHESWNEISKIFEKEQYNFFICKELQFVEKLPKREMTQEVINVLATKLTWSQLENLKK